MPSGVPGDPLRHAARELFSRDRRGRRLLDRGPGRRQPSAHPRDHRIDPAPSDRLGGAAQPIGGHGARHPPRRPRHDRAVRHCLVPGGAGDLPALRARIPRGDSGDPLASSGDLGSRDEQHPDAALRRTGDAPRDDHGAARGRRAQPVAQRLCRPPLRHRGSGRHQQRRLLDDASPEPWRLPSGRRSAPVGQPGSRARGASRDFRDAHLGGRCRGGITKGRRNSGRHRFARSRHQAAHGRALVGQPDRDAHRGIRSEVPGVHQGVVRGARPLPLRRLRPVDARRGGIRKAPGRSDARGRLRDGDGPARVRSRRSAGRRPRSHEAAPRPGAPPLRALR